MARKTANEIARLSFGERLKLAHRRTNSWLTGVLVSVPILIASPFVVAMLPGFEVTQLAAIGMIFGSVSAAAVSAGICMYGASRDYHRIVGPIYENYGIIRETPSKLEIITEGTVLDSFDHVLPDGQRGTASLVSMGPDAEPQLVFAPDPVVTVQLLDALPISPLAPALEARP